MKRNFLTLCHLVKRETKIFLSDKAGVFFSLLAPLIVLFLYVMFLGDVQMNALESALQGLPVEHDVMRAFVDGWMLAGVLSTSCITVSFSAQSLMIADRETGVNADMLTSPVNRGVLRLGYLAYTLAVTAAICFVVLAIALVYLAISGWYLSVGDVFELFGVLLASVASAAMLSNLICMALRTQSAHSVFVGIMSAAIGFLIGAYMPLSAFPKAIQYIVLFIPGTYSACVFRDVFMRGALAKIAETVPAAADGVADGFSMTLDGFGTTLHAGDAWLIFALSIVAVAVIYAAVCVIAKKKDK